MSGTRTIQSPLVVGRDEHLANADRWIADAAAGNGRFVLLAGEPGVGKSRLLGSILLKARAARFRLAKGDLTPLFELVTFAALHDLARTMGPDFGDLSKRLLAVDPTGETNGSRTRRVIVRDLAELMLDAIDRPTVLAFDDLQWADEMTLEVITELARGAGERPLLLLGAYRVDELPRGSIHREWRSRLLTQRMAEEVRLGRLDHDETGLVTTLLLGSGLPAPREVVDAVYRRTNGIPLHIEELLAAVGSRGGVDERLVLGASVPDTIEDTILAHTGRLSEDAQAVARAGAVVGRCFVPEVLAGILDRPIQELDEPIAELVDAGILFPFTFIEDAYFDFRHQLLRDALYSTVPPRDLRRFHGRAAEFTGGLIAASEIHASFHFERAGLRDEAFRAALGGADAASRVSSHREALTLYRRAIDNMPDGLPERERASLLLHYSDTAAHLDRDDLCRDYAVRAREIALRAGDHAIAVDALINLIVVARRDGVPLTERRHLARQAANEAEALPDSPSASALHAAILSRLALIEIDGLNLPEARRLALEVDAEGRAAGLVDVIHEAQANLARVDIVEGRVAEGLAALRSIGDESRAVGAEAAAVDSYRDAALFAIRSLEYEQAKLRIHDGLRYADEIEQSHCGHLMASASALIAWADGRWDDAIDLGGHALSDEGSGRAKAVARWALGYTAAGRGDRLTAEGHLHAALEFGQRADWIEMLLPPLWGLAEAALVDGDPAAAIAVCEDALALARERGEWALLAPFAVTGVRALQAAGKPEGAVRFLAQLIRALGPAQEIAAPAVHHATGLIKLAEGSVGAAREALQAAVAGWDARGRRWEGLWARLDLAGADLRANRYAEAMALVRDVRMAAEPIGSQPLIDRAEHLTRLAKGRGAELEPWHPLTTREFEVATKIAEGLTNVQIGEALFVSRRTVSAHVEHILAKLGVARRTEVATWVASIGLPHPGPRTNSEPTSPARVAQS